MLSPDCGTGAGGAVQSLRELLFGGLADAAQARSALDARYWQRAIEWVDVLDLIPAAQRNEWQDLIREQRTPAFEEESVQATLMDWLNSRERLFAQKVDGIF